MAPPRIAALDVGSNTVHLLVAEPAARGVREVRRVVVMPRIGAAVNATGVIGAAKVAEVAAEVSRLAAVARSLGASVLLFCATEAVRQAGDRDEALRAFSTAAGTDCVLLSGDAEARLSFRGAVSTAHAEGVALVCDIGGGSTELVLGTGAHIDALASLPIGSGTATDRWLAGDPPAAAQLDACLHGVLDILRNGAPTGTPQHLIATGGTAATLPRLLARDSPESVLDAADLDRCRTTLLAAPSNAVAHNHSLDPARARVLAGGVQIIDAIRQLYKAPAVRTTIHGLRTGMILAYLENGDRWVDG